MRIKINIEITKFLKFDFELSSDKNKEDKGDDKKEPTAPTPSK
jgi:hypothetical protein